MSNHIRGYVPPQSDWIPILLGMASLASLYAISHWNFLLFHCLTEAISIVIGVAVCVIYWNTRRFLDCDAYFVIGLGCLFAGILDLIYILAYPGMSVFPGADGNIALQAKTVAQWYVSLSCICAVPFLHRKINSNLALLVYSAILALALGAIFYWRVFPDCYIEGVGITPFARLGLVISCGAYLGTIYLLVGRRRVFDGYVFKLLIAGLCAFLVEDFASLLATDINGFARTVAHLCQIVAISFVYKVFVEIGLTKPYDLLFRKQQQNAEALQIILDSVPAWVFYKDRENRFLRVNKTFARIMGMHREQLEGRSMVDFYPAEQAESYGRDDQEVIASGKPRTNIVEPIRIKSEQRWVQTDKIPYRDTQGHIIGVIGFSVDITDRKRAEETLRQSRDQLAKLADNLPHSVVYQVTHDADGNRRFLYVSAAAERVLGITPEEVKADASVLYRQILEPFRPVVEQAEIASAQNQSLFDIEVPTRVTDGTIKWLHICSMPYRPDDGPMVWNGIATDITDRKAAEQALRDSESRYRLLVETIPQLAWRSSADGLEIDCNRRWYEYTGQTPGQIGALGWLAAVHPDDLFRVTEHVLHAANAREPYEVEYRLRRASDGRYRWHLARAIPVLGDDGQVMCWVGAATDIEDLKQAQQLLKQSHDEQLERHRTELAHMSRLSMMGEMAASLAHELNQPLHAVNNYASGSLMRILKTPQRDEEVVTALEQISEEANRAAEIVRRIRGFVQKREPQFSEVSVNALVEEVLLISKAELKKRRVEVVLELSERLPVLIGDPVQIEQVIMNLVCNGMEAMDETLQENRLLGVKTMRDGDEMVQVEVCDRGSGIDKENLGKIFEPFFTTKPEGMGMGLAISQSIVQSHGGHLWVSLNPEGGCSFHFALPVGKRS